MAAVVAAWHEEREDDRRPVNGRRRTGLRDYSRSLAKNRARNAISRKKSSSHRYLSRVSPQNRVLTAYLRLFFADSSR